jgi:hypothetical protein
MGGHCVVEHENPVRTGNRSARFSSPSHRLRRRVSRGWTTRDLLLRAGDPRPPRFARGATYHQDALPDSGLRADVLVECTAAPTLVADVPARLSPDAIACLIGASGVGFRIPSTSGH